MLKLWLFVSAVVIAPSYTFAARNFPDGVDLTRPRILFRHSDVPILQRHAKAGARLLNDRRGSVEEVVAALTTALRGCLSAAGASGM